MCVCGGPEWAWPAVHKDRGPKKPVRPSLAISSHAPASAACERVSAAHSAADRVPRPFQLHPACVPLPLSTPSTHPATNVTPPHGFSSKRQGPANSMAAQDVYGPGAGQQVRRPGRRPLRTRASRRPI